MELVLDKALERAAIIEVGSTLGCPNLSKLKLVFLLKYAIAVCNICLFACILF
jgi:hypothetical protein